MRRLVPALILAPVVFTACRRPEVEAFRQAPPPLVVTFRAAETGTEGGAVEQEYAAALRARLATRTTVVPEGIPAPEPHVRVEAFVSRAETHRGQRPDAVGVGVATGVLVGTLGAIAGDRHAFERGLWWGLWAGTHQAAANQHHRWWREVVPPNVVKGHVRIMQPGNDEPLWVFSVEPEEVLDAMDPLRNADKEDPQRIREEEAKGFARVVVSRLSERFHWPLRRDPAWYRKAQPDADRPAEKRDGLPQ